MKNDTRVYLLAVLLTSLSALPGIIYASDYLGISISGAQSNLDKTFRGRSHAFQFDDSSEFQESSFSDSDSDSSFKLFGGYRFSNDMLIEYGYLDMGKHKISGAGSIDSSAVNIGNPTPPVITEEFERNIALKGLFAAYGYQRAISNSISLVPRIGVYVWDLKSTYLHETNIPSWSNISRDLSTTGTSLLLGVGLGFGDFSIEYEYYPIRDDDINLLSVSYRF